MSGTNRTSKSAREADAATMEIPSLKERFIMAGQTPHPLSRSSATDAAQSLAPDIKPGLPEGTHEQEPIYHIPLDLIDPNPYNARHIYREERIREMAITLGADGQLQPALATLREGRYVLAAGHYRYRGAKVAGLPTLKIILREAMTNRELFELSYKENNEREGQSALDNAISWSKALADGIYASETALSEANVISLPTVNKTLALLKLPTDTLEEVKQAPNAFGLSLLYELLMFSQVATPERTLEVAKLIRSGDISRREIEAFRRTAENPKPRKPREGARQHRIIAGGSQIGSIKEWDSGKVMLEVKLDDPIKRSELVSELRKRFGLTSGEGG